MNGPSDPERGAASGPVRAPWPAEAIWQAVEPMLAGFSVEVLPQIDSTNSELMRRARAGQCDAILLVAERQMAGRGRVGRQWHSDASGRGGSLTFSVGLTMESLHWSGMSLAAGLALAEALHPQVQLKWPNDLWWNDRKLAGILIETAALGDVRYVVVGVGINLVAVDAASLSTPSAGLQELLPSMDGPTCLLHLVPPLVRALQTFATQGFLPLQAAFHRRDALYGRNIIVSDGISGMARGVDALGALLVHTAAGVVKVSSAEVSVRPAASTP